jgi:hypothetical protein
MKAKRTGLEIYLAVCAAPDTEATVAAMCWEERHALYAHVLQTYCENAASGMILGVLSVDAARRLYEGEKPETRIKTQEK